MFEKLFFNNYLLAVGVSSWVLAQIIKTAIYLIINREFRMERLVGSGGMPSSHSALVTATMIGTIIKHGVSSSYFAIAFVLALIVMYDAMGVRLETGKQARLLNQIVKEMLEEGREVDHFKNLKEMVGHTPFQVVAGAALGALIALLVPVF